MKNSRIFSLQRIVEVTDLNMDRIKIIWAKIWQVLQTHFSKAGCCDNHNIAIYAIDSLKQLSKRFLKVIYIYKHKKYFFNFLQKEEYCQFEYQKEFLKPFEVIFSSIFQNIF